MWWWRSVYKLKCWRLNCPSEATVPQSQSSCLESLRYKNKILFIRLFYCILQIVWSGGRSQAALWLVKPVMRPVACLKASRVEVIWRSKMWRKSSNATLTCRFGNISKDTALTFWLLLSDWLTDRPISSENYLPCVSLLTSSSRRPVQENQFLLIVTELDDPKFWQLNNLDLKMSLFILYIFI